MKLNQAIVSVTHIPGAVGFYKTLGFQLIVLTDTYAYARFIVPCNGATFSLHLAQKVPPTETALYFECDDVDVTYAQLTAAGIVFLHPPVNQPWLWREAHFTDPDGNPMCIYHAGENRLNPPWRIKETVA